MGLSVAELLERFSSRELSEWMAYARLEPFGEERADLRLGMLSALVYNRTRTEKEEPKQWSDFVPKFGEQEAAVDNDMLQVKIRHIFGMLAARSPKGNA